MALGALHKNLVCLQQGFLILPLGLYKHIGLFAGLLVRHKVVESATTENETFRVIEVTALTCMAWLSFRGPSGYSLCSGLRQFNVPYLLREVRMAHRRIQRCSAGGVNARGGHQAHCLRRMPKIRRLWQIKRFFTAWLSSSRGYHLQFGQLLPGSTSNHFTLSMHPVFVNRSKGSGTCSFSYASGLVQREKI